MKFFSLLLIISYAQAAKLSKSNYFNYEVFFTNPICKEYKYDEAVYSVNGKLLDGKPKNVYCKRGDFDANSKRESSPHFNLKKLINDNEISELFFTFLSFSNSEVSAAICEAIKRNVKVTFIMDSKNQTRSGATRYLDQISKCKPENVPAGTTINKPKTFFRGNTRGLGYAHNKLILANYKNSDKVKIVFGSANMSSGTILHHENWHFITTEKETFFYQAHLCLRDGMLNKSKSRSEYKKYIKTCRQKVKDKYEEEEDITFYIVPTDGKEAMDNIVGNIKKAKSLDVAVHRFTHTTLINTLARASRKNKEIRLVADDDIYWSGVQGETVGSNMIFEYYNIIDMVKADINVRYMETNQNSRLLHHNKYIIFNYSDGTGAVHAGAGNFTKAAFSKNFENYYFIKIPSVVETFKKQYNYMFEKLATKYVDMPVQYVMP
jgi:phosphatidylserine/phosphatidylglycerophosphate/cardiolipin synthase-like enzyme